MNEIKMQKEKSEEKRTEETQSLMKEKHKDKSVVGLFSKFDKL